MGVSQDNMARQERLNPTEVRLVLLESLQWCANNAVYFLGLIGAATYELGGDAFLVAGITLTRNLANSVGNAMAGPVIDRIGPRKTSLFTLACSVVCSAAMVVLPSAAASLYFAALFLGLCGGFINTCTRAYPAYLASDKERLKNINGKMNFYSNLAFMLGPIAGGFLVSMFPTRAVFGFMAVVMAVAIAVTWECRELLVPQKDPDDEKIGILSGMAEGARLTFANRKLRIIFLSGFLGFFAFGAFDSLESIFYRDVLRVDVVWLGLLSAAAGATASLGSWLLTRIPAHRVNLRLLLLSLMGIGIASMVYVGTDVLGIAIVGQALNGLSWGLLEPVQGTLVQEEAPMSHMGRIMGFQRFGLMSAGVLPLLAAPFLAEVFGAQGVLFGASTIIACVGTAFYVHEVRRDHRLAA